MRQIAIAAMILGFMISIAPANAARRHSAQVHPAQNAEAIARFCRAASNNVRGFGRDVKKFLYFDECLRRGGRM